MVLAHLFRLFLSLGGKLLKTGVFHFINTRPLLSAIFFDSFGAVYRQKTDQFIAVNPDLVISFFLGFVKNELQSKMQVRFSDVVGVFSAAVPGVPEITDQGFVIAAVVGILSIKLVSWLVKKDRYKIFGVYTAVLGAACVAAGLWEHISGNTLHSLIMG